MNRLLPLFSWRSAICQSDLASTTRHVALTLSLYMSERGDSAYPGAERLASDTGLTVRCVRQHLKTLEERGWLVCRVRGGGAGKATEYAATIPETVNQIHCSEHRNSEPDSLFDAETVNLDAQNGEPGSPQLFKNSQRRDTRARAFDFEEWWRLHPEIQRDFEEWWSFYPRKVSRPRAEQRYAERRRAGVSRERLLAAVHHFARGMEGREPEFIKHPDGFLAARGPWRDWEHGNPDRRQPDRPARSNDWFSMLASLSDPRPEIPITAEVLDLWSRRR
jgi:hypothetical protein